MLVISRNITEWLERNLVLDPKPLKGVENPTLETVENPTSTCKPFKLSESKTFILYSILTAATSVYLFGRFKKNIVKGWPELLIKLINRLDKDDHPYIVYTEIDVSEYVSEINV
jgi:hypothetical protein